MAQEKKRVLVVDDTMVDRVILKSILDADFKVLEADSGNRAFEYITTMQEELDVILLDLSMPHINGFDVLKFMNEKNITDIPVFVVTAEPTKVNVEKAFQYNVCDFIGKPFDREDILRRLRSRLGIVPEYNLSKEDFLETTKYIAELETFYKAYLNNFEKSDAAYKVRSDLMRIMLNAYSKTPQGEDLNQDNILLISKAAYFCDIGEILVPESEPTEVVMTIGKNKELEDKHTIYGSNFIRLNRSKACEYFVEVCAGMCLHHHERYDGKGYPHGIKGKNNSFYNQICRVLDEFESKRSKFYGDRAKPIKYIIGRLVDDMGVAGKEVNDLLEKCEPLIFDYFV
ncbi:MAG: response regulator [Clostridium sp.]|nr:response regulator [Clostridium sp.]